MVSVRAFGVDRNLGEIPVEDFVNEITEETNSRGATRLIAKFENDAE